MTRIPLQGKDNFERSKGTTQVEFLGDSPVNYALIAVAQEVAELLKQVYPVQAGGSERTGTITVCTIKPSVED